MPGASPRIAGTHMAMTRTPNAQVRARAFIDRNTGEYLPWSLRAEGNLDER